MLDAGGLAAPAPAPATHFALLAPANETAGHAAALELVALDASNHIVRNFTGTATFSSSGAGDALPADYTFTAHDHGKHLFQITLATSGSDTVTATDAADSISGDTTVNVNPAPVTTHFLVYTPENTTVGASTNVVVVALDASNHRVNDYAGTVNLTTSDPGVTTPVSYTFTSGDHGVHVFQEKFATAGVQTVTASDASNSALTGTSSLNVNPAPVATHFLVYTPENTTVGASTNVVVVALDASNHRVNDYAGTVNLTTSDPGVTTPVSYTFTSHDHGVHVFQESFATAGVQTVTATDAANSALTDMASINVNPAPVATHFAVFARGPIIAGTPSSLEVVALDASNHLVPDYTGTIHFTSSVTGDTLPADYTFAASDQGKHRFQVTLASAGSNALTVSDGTLTGSVVVTVHAAPPPPTSAGQNGGANSHASGLAGRNAVFAAFAESSGWHWRHY